MHTKFTIVAFATLAATGCGHAAGTHPHDMSAEGHEAAAAAADHEATEHAAQHDPNATGGAYPCDPGIEVCWDDVTNPTAEHLDHARQHREAAAQHRAASDALKSAEASACAELPERDRDMSPFAHVSAITGVSELRGAEGKAGVKNPPERTVGATVRLRAVPGLTDAWLQRLVNCHLARAAAAGFEMPEMPYCPLMVRGATAKVRTLASEFAIDIHAEGAEGAAEVWRRAQQLQTGK